MRSSIETQNGADGSRITAYTLANERGMQITALDFGATLASVRHTAANGRIDELLIGFRDRTQHLPVGSYVGSTVGRVANRIKDGRINIGGVWYPLTQNFGAHTLHGGARGLSYRPWVGRVVTGAEESVDAHGGGGNESVDAHGGSKGDGNEMTVRLTRTSPHLEEGFPGELHLTVDYTLTADNRLVIAHRAEADRDTAVNLTHHGYWNLSGGGALDEHLFQINADSYLVTDAEGLSTGGMQTVDDSGYDFRALRRALVDGVAPIPYDLCYHLNHSELNALPVKPLDRDLTTAAFITTSGGARSMLISTSYPALQFFLPAAFPVPPTPEHYSPYGAFCMECMLHLDATRSSHLPTTILPAGKLYQQRTVHQFT